VLALGICVKDSSIATHTRQHSFPPHQSLCHQKQQLLWAAATTFAAGQGRRPAILRDYFASVSIKEDQGRNALDAKHLAQNLHKLALSEWQSKPRHLFHVVLKLHFVLVRGHEDHFKLLARALDLAVGVRQPRGKAAARRTPARRGRSGGAAGEECGRGSCGRGRNVTSGR